MSRAGRLRFISGAYVPFVFFPTQLRSYDPLPAGPAVSLQYALIAIGSASVAADVRGWSIRVSVQLLVSE